MPDITITLPDDLHADLQEIAHLLDTTLAELVIRALENTFMDDTPPDLVAAKLREAIGDVNAGRTYTLDEVLEEIRQEQESSIDADQR